MTRHITELVDGRLNAESASDCALHFILGHDSMSCLATSKIGEVLALEAWEYSSAKTFEQIEREPRKLFAEEQILKLPYGQFFAAVYHPHITLIPRRLFQHGSLQDYFNLILKPGDFQFTYEEIPEFEAYAVFATELAQAKLFTEIFPKVKLRHLAVPVLRYIRSLAGISDHTVFVNLRSKSAQIAVLERQNLLFFNTYAFTTPTDLLYFILLAYDQFRLKPEEVPLTLAGSVLKDSDLYRILYRFIKEIRFAVPPVQFQFSPDMAEMPGHCYLDLFCLKNY